MKKCPKLPAALPAKQSKSIIIRTISFFAIMLLVIILPGKLFAAAPAITSFSPATGSVGTLITINGTNLSNPTALTIGGRSAIVISNTGSALVAMVMPGTGAGKVSITTTGGTATSVSSFTVTTTPFPSAQQGSKLVGSGSVGKVSQGISASLSSDGNTALIGGPDDNTGRGAAWVYTRSGGIWTQQGTKLVGTGSVADAGEGLSVSLSADGNTALIGGYQDNYPAGAAWVFTRSGGIWTQQGTKLVGTGGAGATQGRSVSLSADGNTAIVGGPNDSSDVGAAWVYTRSDGVWTQQGTKLVGTGSAGGAFQGVSVSLSADGNMALVGGSFDNSGTGAVWVFTRSGGIWTQQGTKLVGTGSAGAANQGSSVSLSADGNTAMVGGDSDNSNAGAAWIYIRSGGTWAQQGSKLVGSGSIGSTGQGHCVSLSADGNTAIVGGNGDNTDVGAVWVYTRNNGAWSQKGSKLVGTGAIGGGLQGTSVALSADGSTAMEGAWDDNSDQGAAWAFIAVSANATLSTIALTPAFTLTNTGTVGSTITYTTAVGANTSSVTVTPTTQDPGATVTVNGTAVTSGTASAPVPLPEGANTTINTMVTAPDGITTRTYSIIVTRPPSTNTSLSTIALTPASLLVNTGTVGATVTYTTSVSNATASVTVTPTAVDPNATITVNGISVATATASGPIALSEGATTTINTVVTSPDGTTTKTYSIIVTRPPSTNALLSTIAVTPASTLINAGTVGSTTTYTTTAANATASVTVTPAAEDPNATITVNGAAVTSGTASDPVDLTAGANTTITVVTTSQDGSATRTYSIIVTRAPSNNATLNAIVLSPFSALTNTGTVGGTTTFTTSVSNPVASVTVTPTSVDANATITVNGTAVPSATASGSIALAAGATTTINIIVRAQDGTTTRTYAIVVTRLNPNTLDNLGLTSSTPAAGAYSLRVLSSSYNRPLVRITIGANYYDVYPDASKAKIFSLSSPISAAYTRYNAPVTAATTNLLSSIIAGKSATVAIWYDQSGNGYDAIQADPGTQPEIISGGAIDVTNTLPTIKFLGANYLVVTSTAFNNDLSGSVVFNATSANNTSGTPDLWHSMNGIFGSEQPYAVNDFGYGILNNKFTAGNGPIDNSVAGATVVDDGTTRISSWTRTNSSGAIALFAGGLSDGSGIINSGTRDAVPSVAIGAITTTGGGDFNGTLSEITVFPTVYTLAQRQTIEGNQKTYYSVAPPSGNAALNAIVLNPFSALTNTGTVGGTTTFTTSVSNPVASVTVTPTSVDANATITVNGTAVPSATASGSIALAAGAATTINIIVRAQDGTTTRTYAIVVTRLNPNTLDNLGLTSSTPAAGAYSLRVLSSSYNRPLVRITIGANYYDVYPDASKAKIFSLSSPISAAYARYNAPVTAATTNLLSSIIAGKSATVAIWYDQSGNDYDAIQTDPGTQPEIISGGAIDVTNALPTIKFSGANYLVVTSAAFNNDLSGSVVFNATNANNIGGPPAAWPYMNGIIGSEQPFYVNDFGYGILNNVFTAGNGPADNSIGGATVVDDGTTRINSWTRTNSSGAIALFAGGLSDGSGIINSGTRDAVPSFAIGAITTTGGGDFNGTLSEITIFPTVYTLAQRQTIEGNQETYYGVAPAINPLLASIALTPASKLLNSGTSGSTTTYTTSVVNATASVTVTPVTQDPGATVTVNGVAVTSGTASGPIALTAGADVTINTVVTARDGITKRTYVIIVTRAPSSNASLTTITLTPASALTNTGPVGSTTTYTTSVGYSTASVTVTPAAQDNTATITVNGVAVASGAASGSIALAVGQTTINTVVTAQDGTTTHTYSITITRAAPSTNALLSIIQLTPASALTNTGTSGAATTYTASVGNATTSVTVTATAQNATATIKVNGTTVTSGTASGSIALAVGANTITTVVTAQDGTTTHTYSITVTRATGPLMSLYMPISVVQPADNISIENDGVLVHQGISPNGDGMNDYLHIDGITAYPDNKLTIIDRSGAIIFEAKGYNNISKVFDGHSGLNGRMQQPGTYFYTLDYVVNGQIKHKTGYIILKY